MSATISCLTPQRSGFFGSSATPVPTLFFSTLMSDEAKSIARGLRKRDPDLLDRLIEQYQYRLFRYLLYITGNKERSEDFFQETWIRVLERGHQYDGKSKFEAWLFSIARHLVIDWQRTKKPQSLDTLTDPEQEHPLQLVDETDPSPLRQVLSQETEENVQASLQRIPAIYREVLVLRFQEELQIEEMAGVLSVPLSTVKSRLYRGLEALRGIDSARARRRRLANRARMAQCPSARLRALRQAGAPNGACAARIAHSGDSLTQRARPAHAVSRATARGGVARTWPRAKTFVDHCRRFVGARNRERPLGMARVRVGGTPDRRAKADLGSWLRNVVGGAGAAGYWCGAGNLEWPRR